MREHTALEIANKLDYLTRSVMSIHNVPTLPKLCDCGEKGAEMLRQQHAEIERLKRERHHIYDLLARIHRDGGQYTAEHGIEKSCDDAEAKRMFLARYAELRNIRNMQIGGKYNWKGQPERLVYLGHNWSGNGLWHQFAEVGSPSEVWCEVLDEQLASFEETPHDEAES